MKIQQIYTNCMAQAAYYLESNGEVAIFDPLREVEPYIKLANDNNAKIKYIFETHFHADFVSGHLDLAKKTGATIVYGTNAKTNFNCIIATDNQLFTLGNYTIKALHTPGHTLESTCFLLFDENNNEYGIITGDTLFIGDVGRPDLAQKMENDLTQEKLASMLFDSLRNKIMPLPNHIIIFPSHGAGSACGKNMSKETTDTLENQKLTNYALRENMTREEFIAEVLDGLQAPPTYFPQNVALNSEGYLMLDSILQNGLQFLEPSEFLNIANNKNAIILDVRTEQEFVIEHIKNSIFIGLNGQFAPWVGSILGNVNTPILLITPEGKEEETIIRLSRVGFDTVLGILKGGIENWKKANLQTDSINSITPNEFALNLNKNSNVIDARKPNEFEAEHIENAVNVPLNQMDTTFNLDKNNTYFVHCAGGYRSVIMASILKKQGFHNLINIEKGMAGIKNTSINLTKFVCPSTL